MLTYPDAALSGADVRAQAISWLRGRPNPFDSLVRPQRPDEHFRDAHEPSVHQQEYAKLAAAIDSYRRPGHLLQRHQPGQGLADSRVASVVGARGAGKTHLLDALALCQERPSLLVRPAFFVPEVPFDEWLLADLVGSLRGGGRYAGEPPLRQIAVELLARLVRPCLAGDVPLPTVDALRGALYSLASTDAAAGLVRDHGLAPDDLVKRVERFLCRWEQNDSAGRIRRWLYVGLVRNVLLGGDETPGSFLEAEPGPAEACSPRPDVVRQLLVALVEMCALVRLPVVFAFDNLEGLLAPHGELSPERVRAFLDGLAQAVDATRGVLFLLFAESELYRGLRTQGNPFALSRLDQGVSVPEFGLVDVVTFEPVGPEALRRLIERRIGRELHGFSAAEQLPRLFPFTEANLAPVERMDVPLRTRLLRLRDEYTRLIYPPTASAPDPQAVLHDLWQAQLRNAEQEIERAGMPTLAAMLNQGLRRMIESAGPVVRDGWRLIDARVVATRHLQRKYAQVTVIEWQQVADADDAFSGKLRVAVGFLLSSRSGLPVELEARCSPLTEPARPADGLILLWPTATNRELPRTTKDRWDAIRPRQSSLRHLSKEQVCRLVAAAGWQQTAEAEADGINECKRRDFLTRQLADLLPLIVPPESWIIEQLSTAVAAVPSAMERMA